MCSKDQTSGEKGHIAPSPSMSCVRPALTDVLTKCWWDGAQTLRPMEITQFVNAYSVVLFVELLVMAKT